MHNSENATGEGDCYPTVDSDEKCDIILGFRRTIGLISMLCCVFIVIVIVLFKKYKFIAQRLIMYLSIAAFFQAIGYVMGDYHIAHRAREDELVGLCIFQGVWVLYFDWVSFLWVCFITLNIFINTIFLKRTEKFEKYYIIISLGLPVIICCFPFIGLSYGPAGLWCWISSVRDDETYVTGVILQFVLFYGPFWILCIVLIATLIFVSCVVHRRVRGYHGTYDPNVDAQKKMLQEEVKPLMLFPWIYIAILVFPSMNRLRYAAGYDDPDTGANFFFWFMHSITLTLHGTVYALIFGCDKQTMSRLKWGHIKAAFVSRWGEKVVKEYHIEASNKLWEGEDDTPFSLSGTELGTGNNTQYRIMDE